MFVPTRCPKHASELQLHNSEDFQHVSFGKVCEVGLIACNVRDTDVRGLCGVSRIQVIVLFQCKLSTSGQARMKDAAFVEE
jgi:hypothetical protein